MRTSINTAGRTANALALIATGGDQEMLKPQPFTNQARLTPVGIGAGLGAFVTASA